MNKVFSWTLASLLLPAATVEATPAFVELHTNYGAIELQLDPDKAPVTVANFLAYLKEGFYQDTIFHRVPLDFVAQGGGVIQDRTGSTLTYKYKSGLHASIVNEASNGLKNIRGSIAMARGSAANSATSQFFINTVDNAFLDYGSAQSPDGYAVFGEVIGGMAETVDAMNHQLRRAYEVYATTTTDPNYSLYAVSRNSSLLYDMPVFDEAAQLPVYIESAEVLPEALPFASAGPDQKVAENAAVILSGSASDPGGMAIASYQWVQTAGPAVELTGADSAQPQFTAPAVTEDTVLGFQVVVTNAQGKTSSADTVAVTVVQSGGGGSNPLDCGTAYAAPSQLWPPNKLFKPVSVQNVTGAGSVSITITGITSDEPVKNKKGKDTTKPDSKIKRDHKTALLRAERQYGKAGNGRVYTVGFQASDGTQTCTGAVKVGVPPTRNATAVDDAAS